MERLVPLTKILMTLAVSVWAIFLRDWMSLMALVVVELVALLLTGLLCIRPSHASHDACIYCTLGNDEVTRFNSGPRNAMQNSL